MSYIFPLNKRSEEIVIDCTIKCSRKLLWSAFLNISLLKYSIKGSQAERQEKEEKVRRKASREGRERKGPEGRRGKKTVLKPVLIPRCLEAPHGCVTHTVPGTNSDRNNWQNYSQT